VRLPLLASPLAALLYAFALKGFNASVTRLSTLQREEHVENVGRPREAADVSREDLLHELTIDDRRFTD